MVVITNDKKEADETKRVVTQQEADANVQADKAKAIAEDAQRDLDAALPALEKAVESLKNLSRNDIVEVKALQNPPMGVKLVMEATCIMFDEKPKMVADPNNVGKKVRGALERLHPLSMQSCFGEWLLMWLAPAQGVHVWLLLLLLTLQHAAFPQAAA